ncbi:MAG: hypothetical protein H6Q76_500 [Firmicutes bacterium]|nr:hypothetical protein [Bacillota bacterium]
MSIEDLFAEVDATVVSSGMIAEMMERLSAARKESQEAARQKAVDEDFLSLTCSL